MININLITTAEAAKILLLTPSRVRQLCEEGKLVAYRTNGTSGHWRVDRDQLLRNFQQQQQQQPGEVAKTGAAGGMAGMKAADCLPDVSVFKKIRKLK